MQEHGGAVRSDTGVQARRLELHQGHQSVHLRLVGHQAGEDAPEPERLVAQLGTEPLVAGGGRVTLVEDEVDHLEHGVEAGGAVVAGRDLEGDTGLGDRLLGAHDALRDRRLRQDVGPGDLGGREAADEA